MNINEIRDVFRHEYTHALVSRMAGSKCPVWLHEGLAQILDGTSQASAKQLLSRGGAPSRKLFVQSFSKIRNAQVVRRLYAASLLFTQWLANRGGGVVTFDRVLKALGNGKSIDQALKQGFAADLKTLYQEWLDS